MEIRVHGGATGRPPPGLRNQAAVPLVLLSFLVEAVVPLLGHRGFLLMEEFSQMTGSPSFFFEPQRIMWKAGASPLLYPLCFTKAEIGSKMAYRELIFYKVVLLTEGCKRREDNPKTARQ